MSDCTDDCGCAECGAWAAFYASPEFAALVAEAQADIAAGRTIPLADVLDELAQIAQATGMEL